MFTFTAANMNGYGAGVAATVQLCEPLAMGAKGL
jgi:hypothetical protein